LCARESEVGEGARSQHGRAEAAAIQEAVVLLGTAVALGNLAAQAGLVLHIAETAAVGAVDLARSPLVAGRRDVGVNPRNVAAAADAEAGDAEQLGAGRMADVRRGEQRASAVALARVVANNASGADLNAREEVVVKVLLARGERLVRKLGPESERRLRAALGGVAPAGSIDGGSGRRIVGGEGNRIDAVANGEGIVDADQSIVIVEAGLVEQRMRLDPDGLANLIVGVVDGGCR